MNDIAEDNGWARRELRGPRIITIVELVATAFDVAALDIVGPRRHADLATARQVAYTLAHECGYSYPAIGRAMKRDHTTVICGVQSLKRKMRRDRRLAAIVWSFLRTFRTPGS